MSAKDHQDPTEYLRSATFSRGEGSTVPLDNAVTASDLLLGDYDPAKLHPLADLGDKLDYLLLEDDKTTDIPGAGTAIPSRGWGDDLCYGTGTMYLSGEWRSRSLLNYDPFHPLSASFLSRKDPLSPYHFIPGDYPWSFLLFFSHHMLTDLCKAWPLVGSGAYAKVLEDL